MTAAQPQAPASKPGAWDMFKQTLSEYSEDKVPRLSAALAFYAMLSIAPLLIITIKIVAVIFGRQAAEGQIQAYTREVVGEQGAAAVQQIVQNAATPGAGIVATTISAVVLLFSASGVFGELQDSLNTVWDVKPRPDRGVWGMIKDRFFSMTLVLGVGFLLIVSLIASTLISAIIPGGEGFLWQLLDLAVTAVIFTGLFALMFKYLPDVQIAWRDVWVGAATTAILFVIGKILLSWYLGRASTTSVYGAAGSLVALLLWVYYSAQIFFIGAEFTQVYARRYGTRIEPARNAVPLTPAERATLGIPKRQDYAAVAREEAIRTGQAQERYYPAVPANRNLAVTPPPASSASAASRLVPLLAGVALGKLLLGGKKEKPRTGRRHGFAPVRLVEPGWSTRARQERDRGLGPVARRFGEQLRQGYRRARHRVAEYVG